MPNSEYSVTELQRTIDDVCNQLEQNWKGKILFPVCPTFSWSKELIFFQETDLCSFIGGNSPYQKLYFCLIKYPLPSCGGKFDSLKIDLERAALESGSPVYCNGGGSSKKKFRCNQCINRSESKREVKKKEDRGAYIDTSLVNQRTNSRGSIGRSMLRRCKTLVSNHSSSFQFTIRWDNMSPLTLNSGCPFHNFHASIDPSNVSITTRFLGENEKETLFHLAQSCCGNGVSRNYVFSKRGRFLSCSKVAYLYDRDNNISNDFLSDYDKLLDYFQKTDDIAYTVLWNIPVSQIALPHPATPNMNNTQNNMYTPSRLFSHTKLDAHKSSENDIRDKVGMLEVHSLVQSDRVINNTNENSKVFIAVAWVVKRELLLFKMFPEVMHVGATSHSSSKKYHLLTFSVKTAFQKHVIFLRMWIPDQKRSTFRWVFRYCLAVLVLKYVLGRTRMAVANGDPQQMAGIQAAISEYMLSAIIMGCGWHIVHQGWKKNGPCFSHFKK